MIAGFARGRGCAVSPTGLPVKRWDGALGENVHGAGGNDQDGYGSDQGFDPMNSFARWVSGIASVGLNAIEFVSAT